MKRLLRNLSLLLPLACATAPAQAENVDLSRLSCNDLVQIAMSDQDAATVIIIWIDGYLSGVTGDTNFNDYGIGVFTERLLTKCQQNPGSNVLEMSRIIGIR